MAAPRGPSRLPQRGTTAAPTLICVSAPDSEEQQELGREIGRRCRFIADAVDRIRTDEGHGLLPGATLFSELEDEKKFAAEDPWGSDPIMATRGVAAMGLVAATDYLRAFGESIEVHRTYAPFLEARAVLEACAFAAYLGEQKIGARERVRRLMNERLEDHFSRARAVAAQDDPGAADALAEGREKVRQLTEIGGRLGYRVVKGDNRKAFALDKERPSITRLIGMIFPNGLGTLAYHLTSSPSHSRPAGLLASATMTEEPSPLGLAVGRVGLAARDATFLHSLCVMAIGSAVRPLAEMNGWSTTEWGPLFREQVMFAQRQRQAYENG